MPPLHRVNGRELCYRHAVVESVRSGQRVVITPVWRNGQCSECKRGVDLFPLAVCVLVAAVGGLLGVLWAIYGG